MDIYLPALISPCEVVPVPYHIVVVVVVADVGVESCGGTKISPMLDHHCAPNV
jgi:hypothetical protein